MNLLYLRAFHGVATEHSFTRAALMLHVSQSTLSWQVKALEDMYGVRLLDRRGRRVVPTEIGQRVLESSHELFRLQDSIESLLGQSQKLQAGRLKVGADGPRHVIPVLRKFVEIHPDVSVSLTTGNAKKVLCDLLNYETDVAIVASPKARETRLCMMPYKRYRLVAFVSRDHPLSKKKKMQLKDFDGQRLIIREASSLTRQLLMRALSKSRIKAATLIECDDREASREAVASGMGISVMSATEFPSADKRCVALEIADRSLTITEYVACLKNRSDLRTVREFFRVAAESAQPNLMD